MYFEAQQRRVHYTLKHMLRLSGAACLFLRAVTFFFFGGGKGNLLSKQLWLRLIKKEEALRLGRELETKKKKKKSTYMFMKEVTFQERRPFTHTHTHTHTKKRR